MLKKLFITILFLVFAFYPSAVLLACNSTIDCPGNQVCRSGVCVVPATSYNCVSDTDCSNGQICFEGNCKSTPKEVLPPGVCNVDTDCPIHQVCLNSACKESAGTTCVRDTQCPATQKCVSGVCTDSTATGAATGDNTPAGSLYGLNITAKSSGYSTDKNHTVIPVLNNVVGVALSLAATIFFAMALYAGIRWITARGQEDLVKRARDALEAAIIGLIIVVASYAIASFVTGKLLTDSPNPSSSNTANTADTGGCCTGLSTGPGASAMSYCKYMTSFDQCRQAGGNYVPGTCTGISGC